MFDKHFKDFDNEFKKTERFVTCVMVLSGVVSIAVLGFCGWVVVKLLAYFGVI